MQVAGLGIEGDPGVKALEKFGVDWQVVGIGLLREVDDGVRLSHGLENLFAKEVKAFGEELGIAGRKVADGLLVEVWVELRKIADAEL